MIARILGAILLSAGLMLAACGGTESGGSAGSPPTEAGTWLVWSPDRQVDDTWSERGTGFLMIINHSQAWRLATFGGEPLEPEIASQLRPSLWLSLDVEEGGSDSEPSMAQMRFRLECGPVVRNETVEFDPPKEVGAGGTVSVDLGVLQWDGTFSGSETFSGEWTAGDCGGSWNSTGGRDDDDLGAFLSSEDVAEARDRSETP